MFKCINVWITANDLLLNDQKLFSTISICSVYNFIYKIMSELYKKLNESLNIPPQFIIFD